MRISDWSSDVCSSDLLCGKGAAAARLALAAMADRHADRLAGAGHANLTAAAGGVADGHGHFTAFLSATRTSASRLAPAPRASLAADTRVSASPSCRPRTVQGALAHRRAHDGSGTSVLRGRR